MKRIVAAAIVVGAACALGGAAAASGSGSDAAGSAGSGSAGSGSAGSGSAASGSAGSNALNLPLDESAPKVNAAASPSQLMLGERFTLFVTATFDAGVEVNLREPLELGGAFEARRRVSEDRKAADGRTVREWQIEVIAWDVGELQVPPVAVTFTAFGRAGQVDTNAVPIRVLGKLGEDVDPDSHALQGNAIPTKLLARDWFWIWVTVGIACCIGGVLGLFVYRRFAHRTRKALFGGLVPPSKKLDFTGANALERLLAIEKSGALDRDAARKGAYAEMVEVIRAYLGARYRVVTSDLTSGELLRALAGVAPAEECELVEAWLATSDLVKYSGVPATGAEARLQLAGARSLVVTTTQLAAKPPATAAPAEAA
ncbi:MAG TPA: hypothetical protein VGM88_10640 [Kofleriaceae bacterium]